MALTVVMACSALLFSAVLQGKLYPHFEEILNCQQSYSIALLPLAPVRVHDMKSKIAVLFLDGPVRPLELALT